MAISKERMEELKKLASQLNELSEEEVDEISKSAGLDKEKAKKQMDLIKKVNDDGSSDKDDKFFLFRWIEEYGCYLGTAALVLAIYMFMRDRDSSVDAVSFVKDFIDG